MSIGDNTTVNQETLLKLQSIRKTKTCRNACKKTFNDPRITRYEVPTVPVTVLKNYRDTLVHDTAQHCSYELSR